MRGHSAKFHTAFVVIVFSAFITTGGACYVAFGVAAVTAWVAGVVQNGEKVAAQDNLEWLEGQLDVIDTRLQDKFGETMRVEAGP